MTHTPTSRTDNFRSSDWTRMSALVVLLCGSKPPVSCGDLLGPAFISCPETDVRITGDIQLTMHLQSDTAPAPPKLSLPASSQCRAAASVRETSHDTPSFVGAGRGWQAMAKARTTPTRTPHLIGHTANSSHPTSRRQEHCNASPRDTMNLQR